MLTKSKFLSLYGISRFPIPNYLFLITYSLFLIYGFGCSKKVVSNPQMPDASSTNTKPIFTAPVLKTSSQLWQGINDEKKSLNWLAGDVDLDYKGQPMNVGASAKIIWHRDSIITARITKLGFIQVGRIKITRDSVFIVNQLQSQYLAESINYLETKYGIPADFKTIQNILLGNPVCLTAAKDLKIENNTQDLNFLLTGSNEKYKNSFFIDPNNLALRKIVIEEPAENRTITIENLKPDAIMAGTQSVPFSLQRIITFYSPKTGMTSISIENFKESLEVNVPKPINFVTPLGYSKM